ncbi:AAA family ATPase [candidate division KSB1 bacterium]|nr:AAA family ATPase [candidate division KSB1 bacterium]
MFVLEPGNRARIVEQKQNWLKVVYPRRTELEGWIEKNRGYILKEPLPSGSERLTTSNLPSRSQNDLTESEKKNSSKIRITPQKEQETLRQVKPKQDTPARNETSRSQSEIQRQPTSSALNLLSYLYVPLVLILFLYILRLISKSLEVRKTRPAHPKQIGKNERDSGYTPVVPRVVLIDSGRVAKENPSIQKPESGTQPEVKESQVGNDGSIEVTPEFKEAINEMNSGRSGLFITGKAGTGKTTLLRYYMSKTTKKIALVAPTGIAALHIGGQTIHSFFKFPLGHIQDQDIKVSRNRDMYRALDAIIIDEVSMVRADLMDAIDKFLRLNGRDKNQPFGGIQMIFFGDLFQLPPVVSDREETKFFTHYYHSPFFFDAKVFEYQPIKSHELTKVYRQTDKSFIDLLNAIRMDDITDQQMIKLNHCKERFNNQPETEIVRLTTTNKSACTINQSRLNNLKAPSFRYTGYLEGKFPDKSLPTEMMLILKVGAKVMFVKNDSQKRWVNGTLGIVTALTQTSVRVKNVSNDFDYDVEREKWEVFRYQYDKEKKKLVKNVVGSFSQYPLKLAWAITIHKSQGLTFDKVIIDMGNGAFAHGQTYVALSRCRSLNGISLVKDVRRADIKVDAAVKRFIEKNTLAIVRNTVPSVFVKN